MRSLLALIVSFFSVLVWAEQAPRGGADAPLPSLKTATALKPYHREDFLLAFDTLVAAGDLASALLVAQQAVKSEPMDLGWREKLARVAEWQGKLELAWQQREFLYRHGRRDGETIAALLRLGVIYGEPEPMLSLWLEYASHRPLTAMQWQEIRRLFEKTARPKEGARFFEQQYRRSGNIEFLEWAAQLANDAGMDAEALRLYLERVEREPFSLAAALSAASFLVRQERLREAYRLLVKLSPRVPPDEQGYWKTLGDVAWELVENDTAERAYHRYLAGEKSEQSVLSRLIYLVQQRNPREAAELALSSYRRQGGTDQIMLALDLLANGRHEARLAEALAMIRPEDLRQLEKDPRFLLRRGDFLWRRGQAEQAVRDFEQAVALAPENADIFSSYLWFLIGRHDATRLAAMLSRWQERAKNEAVLWLPFAAAYHVLARYREAAPWYQREIERRPHDLILLLNYADLIDRLQMPGMALRIRRHAWKQVLDDPSLAIDRALLGDEAEELLAQARLFLLDRPGDRAFSLAYRIVARLRALDEATVAGEQSKDFEQIRELILAWSISSGQYSNAKSWMWRQYLKHEAVQAKKPPVWGQSQVALHLSDFEALRRLLDAHAEAMPIHDRYDAAYALHDWRQAQGIAFKGLTDNPVDEGLHDRYRLHAPLHSDYIDIAWRGERLSEYRSSGSETVLHFETGLRLSVEIALSGVSQTSRDAQIDHLVPTTERRVGLRLYWRGTDGDTRFELWERKELDRAVGLRLRHDMRWRRRLGLGAFFEEHAESFESIPLRVAGEQSSIGFNASYDLTKRDTLSIAWRYSRYATQYGDPLGSGLHHEMAYTHKFRTEYPDGWLRFYLADAHYRHRAGGISQASLNALSPEIRAAIASGTLEVSRYFLPESNRTIGVCLGIGENLGGQSLRRIYSRAWRFFFDSCATSNDVAGSGYSVEVGGAGSLTGEDHVSLMLGQSTGSIGNEGINRFLQFHYRHYF